MSSTKTRVLNTQYIFQNELNINRHPPYLMKMNIITRAVEPLKRLVKSDFDFSNMDDFQYDEGNDYNVNDEINTNEFIQDYYISQKDDDVISFSSEHDDFDDKSIDFDIKSEHEDERKSYTTECNVRFENDLSVDNHGIRACSEDDLRLGASQTDIHSLSDVDSKSRCSELEFTEDEDDEYENEDEEDEVPEDDKVEDKQIPNPKIYGEFDVYTMETAMPKIDWDAIEAHLKATKEEERRRRNDREEIRRKLAMGFDEDFERPLRKPSLQSRLQSGMNLQICFMNETASDCESQCSDTESTQDRIEESVADVTGSTTSLNIKGSTPVPTKMRKSKSELTGAEPQDFFSRQAQLQAEARMALGQAKEMARMQMEIEKQQKKKSPIADIVRESMLKIGVHFPDSKRRVSRQILTDMNIAQLQVIVNDLHSQIETLNGDLVTMLLERDDLHMEQDSMLVDIEDLTKHMGAKELSLREEKTDTLSLQNAPRCSPKMTASPKRPRSKSLKLTGSPRK